MKQRNFFNANYKVFHLDKLACLFMLALLISNNGMAQRVSYSLSDLESKSLLITENRTITSITDKNAVRLSAAKGSGVAWLKDVAFTDGTIEVDLRGKDIKQGSFLGIAFHGTSKDDCEAIYFRPFNFLAKDSAARMHMVQYVYDTTYGWERLRNEFPGVYENNIVTPPDPNGWFHVKITVNAGYIEVFVNNAAKPSLQVTSLKKKAAGVKIGLWVGNASEGEFANLKVETMISI